MIIFSVVNYLNYEVTSDFIDSFLKLNIPNAKLLVWDNLSIEKECLSLQKKYTSERVEIIACKDNLGYFGGAFKSYEYYLKNNDNNPPDYFIVCNNDLTLQKSDWAKTLYDLSSRYNNLGVVAPAIISKKNWENQNPFLVKRPPKSTYLKWKILFSSFYICRFIYSSIIPILRRYKKKLKGYKSSVGQSFSKGEKKIYAAQGACFIFTKLFLESNYQYSKIPFLYCEEISVAEHCLDANMIILTTEELIMYHIENVSTSDKMTRFKFDSLKEAQNYILKEFYK